MSLVEFEKQRVVKSFMDTFDGYYTNLGGYHYSKDGSPCYYLNGMLTMFEEQQKKIDELQGRIDATEKWIEVSKKNIPLSEWHGYTTEEYVDADDLLELLKGGKDEN